MLATKRLACVTLRGEYEEFIVHMKKFTMALKSRVNIIRNPKEKYQWPEKIYTSHYMPVFLKYVVLDLLETISSIFYPCSYFKILLKIEVKSLVSK